MDNVRYASDDETIEDWTDECNIAAAFLDHHKEWQRVKAELTCFVLPVPGAHRRRLTALLDRRGRSLPPLTIPTRASHTPLHIHDECCDFDMAT